MNHPRVLFEMVRADFRERTRRYSFLLTLGFAFYLAYCAATGKIVLRLDDYRGVFNSAWLGSMMTLVSTTFLTLIGFYIVKNSILRDEQTRVGRILASTPMTRAFYTLAKTASNFAVLASMLGVLALTAVAMQFKFAEDPHVQIGTLLAPFVWVGLPAMAMTAAVALLFETLPILRGGVGNVIYFFVWGAGIGLGAESQTDDLVGFNLIGRNMQAVLRGIFPGYKGDISLTVANQGQATQVFLWPGVNWTAEVILHRMLWVGAALAAALLASLFFHRFDPAREFWSWKRSRKPAPTAATEEAPEALANGSPVRSAAHLTPMARSAGKNRFTHLVVSELRLMLKGHYWWWYVAAGGLLIATLVSPLSSARQGVLLAAWLWPVLIWSQMGAREQRFATQSLIFSSPRALYSQLPAMWTAGFIVALITGGGIGIRLLLGSDWPAFSAWLAGAMFIPSLALALGVWSGTSKPFEALYTVWWYMGPAHQTPGLDFMGTTQRSSSAIFYVLATAALLAVSYAGRRVRLAYA